MWPDVIVLQAKYGSSFYSITIENLGFVTYKFNPFPIVQWIPRGVVANMLDCDIIVSEIEL